MPADCVYCKGTGYLRFLVPCPDCLGSGKREDRDWYFTFTRGEYAGKYIVIFGSQAETREKMVNNHGTDWCWQYDREPSGKLLWRYL